MGTGSVNHCVWRAHNFSRFFDQLPGARDFFLGLLARFKGEQGILIHSYCLMGNHPHVVCTSTRGQPAFSAFWKDVNQAFAHWVNRALKRRGQVVMERLRSPRIQARGNHMLTVMRYGDLNPVRAGLVRSPKDWPWSSYRHYAFGEANCLIDDAPDYLGLGETGPARRQAYQALLALPLSRQLRVPRPDLTWAFFIGDEAWVSRQHRAHGLAPPASWTLRQA